MGAWGIKALKSDEGFDVLDILREYLIGENYKKEISLKELINLMIKEDMLGESIDEIDYLYDNTAIAIAELYFDFKENGKLDYDNEDKKPFSTLEKFSGDKKSVEYLIEYLTNIYDNVPDEDGEREIVELWDSSGEKEEWHNHLKSLIEKLKTEYEN